MSRLRKRAAMAAVIPLAGLLLAGAALCLFAMWLRLDWPAQGRRS